ncbi:MAG TPA: ribonuclease HI [Clostridia bacterium]|nr:ribonuclease HI [Clostridia bacterium]
MKKGDKSKPFVTIFTDGACSGNPGEGGWAARLSCKLANGQDYVKILSGYSPNTTNNIMELTAVVNALSALKTPSEAEIRSDSAYIVNAINSGWLDTWTVNGWKTSENKPVANKELWQKLTKFMKTHTVKFVKVKGHADDEFNNLCDKLARDAIKNKKGSYD